MIGNAAFWVDTEESRYWEAIGHFKMAAVNIYPGVKIALFIFFFFLDYRKST